MSEAIAGVLGKQAKSFWIAVALLASAVVAFIAFPMPWWAKFSAIDGGICAQQPSHSYYMNGTQLPLDARCTGIYAGFAITLGFLLLLQRGKAMYFPSIPIIVLLVGFVAILGVDGLNSFVKDLRVTPLYQPDNRLRLATGLGTGLAMAILLLPVLNSTIWRRPRKTRILREPAELIVLLILSGLFYLMVVSGFAPWFFPISLISSLGVLLIVSALNLIPVVAVARREGRIVNFSHLLPYWSVALLLAIIELGLMSIFKLWAYATLGVTLL